MSELDDFPLNKTRVREILRTARYVDNGCPSKDFIDDDDVFNYLARVVRWYAAKKGIK